MILLGCKFEKSFYNRSSAAKHPIPSRTFLSWRVRVCPPRPTCKQDAAPSLGIESMWTLSNRRNLVFYQNTTERRNSWREWNQNERENKIIKTEERKREVRFLGQKLRQRSEDGEGSKRSFNFHFHCFRSTG